MLLHRSIVAGGTYFFTVDLDNCRSGLLIERASQLGAAIRAVRDSHPFDVVAWVMLPDHLHAVWTLPDDDAEMSKRWSLVKARFAAVDAPDAHGAPTEGRDVWQRGYRERLIRGDRDLQRHLDYLHFNPVRHGYVRRASDWPHSSIHRYIREGRLDIDWEGDGRNVLSKAHPA